MTRKKKKLKELSDHTMHEVVGDICEAKGFRILSRGGERIEHILS